MRLFSILRSISLFASFAMGGFAFGQDAPAGDAKPDSAPRALPVDGELDPAPEPAEEGGVFKVVPRVDQDPDGKSSTTPPGEVGVSRSRSRQFVVHARDTSVRGAFCIFCDDVRAELLAMLKRPEREKFSYPIHVHVRGDISDFNSGPPVRWDVRMTEGGGFGLIAMVDLGDRFTRDGMRKEIITLLLAERIVRAHPNRDFSGNKQILPRWLRIGVSEAIEFRRRDRPTELFSSIFKSGKMLSVNEIIYAKPGEMNSVSETIYRASCCGFVLALVGQDHGAKRLHGMIDDLAIFEGTPMGLLNKHFPGAGGSENSIEKWWLLELATMAQPTVKDILDPVISEEALGKCLQAHYVERVPIDGAPVVEEPGRRRVWNVFKPRKSEQTANDDPEGESDKYRKEARTVDLSEYRKFLDREDRLNTLDNVAVALEQLSWRAFPLHRPMIQDYKLIIERLRHGNTKGLDEELANLAAARIELLRASKDAADYLLYYQATKVGRLSGAFEPYKRAKEEISKPLPPRGDGLSKYLDALDKEYR